MDCYYDAVVSTLIDRLESADLSLAEALGDLPYSGNQEESNLRKMAPAFSVSEAFAFLFKSKAQRGEMTMWADASRARSAAHVRWILWFDYRRLWAALKLMFT